ncbi:hypothetical protein DFJ73DRAFT_792650 [Zopfochytrium polystomum]|nr:hypothetical protein DFJ73DRAFT_792650 [Zopfochytrium polystomum]
MPAAPAAPDPADQELLRRGLLDGVVNGVAGVVDGVASDLASGISTVVGVLGGTTSSATTSSPTTAATTTAASPTPPQPATANPPVTIPQSTATSSNIVISPTNIPTNASVTSASSFSITATLAQGAGGGVGTDTTLPSSSTSGSACKQYGAECEQKANTSCVGTWFYNCSYPIAPPGLPSGACGNCLCNGNMLLDYISCSTIATSFSTSTKSKAVASSAVMQDLPKVEPKTPVESPTGSGTTMGSLQAPPSSALSAGPIAGIVAACLIVVAITIGAVVLRRRRSGSRSEPSPRKEKLLGIEDGADDDTSEEPAMPQYSAKDPSWMPVPSDVEGGLDSLSLPPLAITSSAHTATSLDRLFDHNRSASSASVTTPAGPITALNPFLDGAEVPQEQISEKPSPISPASGVGPDDSDRDVHGVPVVEVSGDGGVGGSTSEGDGAGPGVDAVGDGLVQAETAAWTEEQWMHWHYARQWHEWQLQQRQWQDQQRAYYAAKEEERKKKLAELPPGATPPEQAIPTLRQPRVYKPSPLSRAIRLSHISTVSASSSAASGSSSGGSSAAASAAAAARDSLSPSARSSIVDLSAGSVRAGGPQRANSINRRVSWESFASVAFGVGVTSPPGSASSAAFDGLARKGSGSSVASFASSSRRSVTGGGSGDWGVTLVATTPRWTAPADVAAARPPSSLLSPLSAGGGDRASTHFHTHVIPGYENQPPAAVVSITSVGPDGALITTQTVTLPAPLSDAAAAHDARFSLLEAAVDLRDGDGAEDDVVDDEREEVEEDEDEDDEVGVETWEGDVQGELHPQLQYTVRQAHRPSGAVTAAAGDVELAVAVGDHVVLWQVLDDGWCEGYSVETRRSGRFPLSCLVEAKAP